MSGVAPCAPPGVTGTLTTTALLCDTLNAASKVDLRLPEVAKPTSVTDDMMPAALKSAMTACTGTSSCKFIGYDFDSDLATPASASRYVVDTYSSTVENSGVLVSKGKKTSGTVSGVVPDTTTGGTTGTVTYTADNGQTYTFQGKWRSVQTSGVSVDVYFDPANMARGGLRPEDLGFKPPVLVEPPGYELPDFQAASIAGSNLISTPPAASVEECAKKCDETDTCTGFNFGGLDTLATCELVKDTTTNRAYVDGKTGFRKETISSTQTGDGSNPSGTDFTNEGIYCRDALACNTDIARIITENVGATNPITALSTTDIDSCAYCPIRTYVTAGNVTTNEIGVSKSNPTPAAAITELQYSSDETFATHLTITAGKWYKMSAWKEQTGGGRLEFYMSPVATSTAGVFNMFCFSYGTFFMSKQFTKGSLGSETFIDLSRTVSGMNTTNMSYNFDTVDYVTNGFTLSIDFIGPMTLKWEGWWHIIPLHNGRLTNEYNNAIFVLSEVSGAVILSAISAGTRRFYDPAVGAPGQPKTYNNPGVFINSNNDKFKLTDDGTQVILSKFTDETLFGWYKDLNPSWDGPFINSWKGVPWIDTDSGNPVNDPVNKFDSSSTFWTLFPTGPDMPDPYAALGQFRTFDIAPPSTAQSWAYDRRQGCDKNCGNITDGYAIYRCTPGGLNCDPGKGAYTQGPDCSGTHISCRPGDDSADLKAQFSFKFRGLLPVSTKVKSGGSNSDHDTDALRVRTIYSLDSTFSISVTPDESTRNLYTIFPMFVIDRILRTSGISSLIPTALCPAGTRVKDYGNGVKACELCPGSPTLASNQVFAPDTANPGNLLCTVTTCPTGQTRDLITNRCRTPCLPGQFVSPGGSCETCPDQTLAGNQYWVPDITNVGSSTCMKNQCPGNEFVNASKTGCTVKCFPGYGRDPANSGQCTLCTVVPTRLQIWVSEILGSIGGQVISFTCAVTTCPDGQYPFLSPAGRVCTPCDQPAGLPTGVTASFSQGCAVNACSVVPNSQNVVSATVVAPTVTPPANCGATGGCTTVGSCSVVCRPGFTGASCTPCPQPPGIRATYSSACIATACSVDTSSPDASKISGATVVNGNCIASCNPGFWKYLEYGCYSCGARTGDDPLTTRTYSQNSCDPVSCAVDASLVGKATAAPASVPGITTSVCMLTPAAGYTATYSTSVTGDYISIAGSFDFRSTTFTRAVATISACPPGDAGTVYTYSSGCTVATCSYTNPADANETSAIDINSSGYRVCQKVCKTGYKRDASGRCTVTCPAMSDPGLSVTLGPYGCLISSCTSSSGFPTSVTLVGSSGSGVSTCAIACPVGARQYTNTNASPNRQDCSKCTTDLSINPWIFSSTCALISNWCPAYGTVPQFDPWMNVGVATATATQSGSTCATTCTSGYVKDQYGVCRKCPGETPSSTSTVVNGVCVTTCKTGHTRDTTTDAKEPPTGQLNSSVTMCTQCLSGYSWDANHKKCVNCSSASTTSTTITSSCTLQCKAGYYYNKTTGVCDTCPAGFYCAGGDNAVQCSAGTYCPTGSGSATACSVGYSCPTAGLGSQTACGFTISSGYIWTNPRVTCDTRQCSAGSYCPDSTTETPCYSGDYCPAGTTSSSHQCPAGYYCPNTSTKTQCDLGFSCPAGSTSQTSCTGSGPYAGQIAAGRMWVNPRVDCTHRACSAGYYCPDATTETACTTAEYYCPAGSASQTACAAACTSEQYESTACTTTTNRVCSTCGTCSVNEVRTGCGGSSAGSCQCDSSSVFIQPASTSGSCFKKPVISSPSCYSPNFTLIDSGTCGTPQVWMPSPLSGRYSWRCPSYTWSDGTTRITNDAGFYYYNQQQRCQSPTYITNSCPSGTTIRTWTDGTQYCY